MTGAVAQLTNLTRNAVYPESPRWYRDRIWFSDVHDYRLKAVDGDGALEVIAHVPGRPSGLGVLPDGSLLMATALDARLNIVDNGCIEEVSDVSKLTTGLLNDLVVHPVGRAYVGDTGFRPAQGEPEAPGRVILRDVDGGVRVVAEDLAFPNGMAITEDCATLYVAETRGQRITTFTLCADGSLAQRRTMAELDFRPDGICLDSAGNIWVAATRARAFVQIDAAGNPRAQVPSPGTTAVACIFAGLDRADLVLCSADTSADRLARGISHGRIDSVRIGVSGSGRP